MHTGNLGGERVVAGSGCAAVALAERRGAFVVCQRERGADHHALARCEADHRGVRLADTTRLAVVIAIADVSG